MIYLLNNLIKCLVNLFNNHWVVIFLDALKTNWKWSISCSIIKPLKNPPRNIKNLFFFLNRIIFILHDKTITKIMQGIEYLQWTAKRKSFF